MVPALNGSPGGLHPWMGQQSIPQPLPKPARHCHTPPAQPLCSSTPAAATALSIPTRCSSRSHSPVKNIPLFK